VKLSRNLASLSLLLILLTACNRVNSNVGCGVLFEYDISVQQKAAKQLDSLQKLPQYAETVTFIQDYGKTRETIRICQKHLKEQ